MRKRAADPTYREAMSAQAKKRWADPVKKAAYLAALHTPEVRRLRSELGRKRYEDPAERQKTAEAARRGWETRRRNAMTMTNA